MVTRRKSASVVLLAREQSSLVDHWHTHIELHRNRAGELSVWANQYGEDPISGRSKWGEWRKSPVTKSPRNLVRELEELTLSLDLDAPWNEFNPLIATIDWVAAAVIADLKHVPVPRLPAVRMIEAQRSLRVLDSVTVGATWGYETHSIQMPYRAWLEILTGHAVQIKKPYRHEGKRFTGVWAFDGRGGLEVGYDDGGAGWVGSLSGLDSLDGPKIEGADLAKLALAGSL